MNVMRHVFYFFDHAHTEASTPQLALGVSIGFLMAWIPPTAAHWLLLLLMLIVVRINLFTAFCSFLCFLPLSFALDSQFDKFGTYLLVQAASLREFWAFMYHAPILPYTSFNNTVVIATTLTGSLIAPFLYFGSFFIIQKYRSPIQRWFWDSVIWRAWLNSRVRRYYEYLRQTK